MADIAATLVGLGDLQQRVHDAVSQSVEDALHTLRDTAMPLAPIGDPGNSTNNPGDLAYSIKVEGPLGDVGVYEGWVGPTVIYGRMRELGTPPGGLRPVYGKYMVFEKYYTLRFAKIVHQPPQPYMKPARELARPRIDFDVNRRLTQAITGVTTSG